MTAPTEIRIRELAEHIGGIVEGDPDRVVRGVATLESAESDQISWVGSARYASKLRDTAAGVVIVSNSVSEVETRATIIRVDDADLAICDVLRLLSPPTPVVAPGVHPTAVIAPTASVDGAAIGAHVTIGEHVRVGPGTQIHPGVRIGDETIVGSDCVLWQNVVLRERVQLGDRVIIHPNSTVGADGFGYIRRVDRTFKIPQVGTVIIDDDVELGANVTIDRARSGETRIGAGTKIDNLVQVGHNVRIGRRCQISSQCGIAGSTVVEDDVILAGQVGLVDHIEIGRGAQIGAQSGVTNDVSAGAVVRGMPAQDIRKQFRTEAATRRLPRLLQHVRELEERLARLEADAQVRAEGVGKRRLSDRRVAGG